MTTLSKEDVVQALEALESMDDFARMDIGVDPIGPYQVLREFIAARADIVEANKALVAENERLKATPPDQRQDLHCVVSDISAECRELRTALAAAELREIKLREFVKNSTEYRCGHPLYEHALAQPRDDSALREMIAGVYEECVQACKQFQGPHRAMTFNDELERCVYAIRALAEKAKA